MKALLKVLGLVLLLATGASAQCINTVQGTWWSAALGSSQTGNFIVTFQVAPSNLTADFVVGVSQGTPTTYTNLAAIVRFGSPTSGIIQAMNGGTTAATDTYQPATGGPTYTVPPAGSFYTVEFDVRLASHTYDAYVTAPGATAKTVIGMNFNFRSPSAAITAINSIGGEVGSGNGQVCNVTIGPKVGVPVLSSISPSSISVQPPGSSPVVLTLTGTGFIAASVPNINGTAVAAGYYSFINATTMSLTVGGQSITTPSSSTITVTNPGAGGGTSNGLGFSVNAGSPNPPNPPTVSSIGSTQTIGLACAQTAPPPASHSVTLTWTASTSTDVTSYNVYRATTNGGPTYTKIGSATLLTYTDANVSSGVTYYYVVTSVAPACPSAVTATTPPCGESVYSNQASASIP